MWARHPGTSRRSPRSYLLPEMKIICASCLFDSIFTARKCSLGQGNIFTGVCLSTEGVRYPSMQWAGGVHPQADPPLDRHTPLGRHPSYAHRHPLGRHPLWADTPPRRAVEITTGAGGTHPTGMHSCLAIIIDEFTEP